MAMELSSNLMNSTRSHCLTLAGWAPVYRLCFSTRYNAPQATRAQQIRHLLCRTVISWGLECSHRVLVTLPLQGACFFWDWGRCLVPSRNLSHRLFCKPSSLSKLDCKVLPAWPMRVGP
ncbi:hypothetical protein BO78DRAFT_157160 [Aspergillus sclerotiicarbonarius CBS 121057]|uniref:Uncharacterized protein n=1 Tax=Aspergillus sclerotiicarbonarius (strain CBS 121057 / IBT 28362) TaxID=1448318 RepID=A0A319E450_ASPSB|nr:hypothetical protein BO78DRAFT_157160 [Aspergillus sclerotiicarbonarius CBS 121057]